MDRKQKKAEYDSKAFTHFHIKLHRVSDEAVIKHIQKQTNKNDYIRQLIIADMEKENDKC